MLTPRKYHSTALLLTDGRVLVAGGGAPPYPGSGLDQPSAEIYSPPYLFKGARPVISSAPTGYITYGSNFFVETPDAGSIGKVALLRLGAVTHAIDMGQRYLSLTFQQISGGLTVQAPSTSNLAPPGYYLLFILNTSGVPSVAKFVKFPGPHTDTQPPTAPSGLTAAGSTGKVILNWTASTDNVGVTGYNLYRSASAGVQPLPENQIGQTNSTSYTDTGFASGTYYYVVTALDAAGNMSATSNEAVVTVAGDLTPPTVSLTAPAPGTTVTGPITVSANASDNVGVVGVQFL